MAINKHIDINYMKVHNTIFMHFIIIHYITIMTI